MLTFALWGDSLEFLLSSSALSERLQSARSWGWLLAIFALVSDLVLPVPATGVMAALGQVYGFWLGWLLGAIGSLLAALTGYGLVRIGRDRVARWLCSAEELRRFQHFFEGWGGVAIIASRIVPILPEVMVVLAGLARMRLAVFLPALLVGTLPVTALFSWWGSSYGQEAPMANFLIAVLVPMVLWLAVLPFLKNNDDKKAPEEQTEHAEGAK